MIDKDVIKALFWERSSIDVAPFIGQVVRLHCYPVSNPEETITFIGNVEYNLNFPMLDVGFPMHEGEKTSFARTTAVSPKIDEPKAYYILKSIEALPENLVEVWFAAGRKFIKELEKNDQNG